MSVINIGVSGYGYWGPILVRNFSQLDQCRVKTVCDLQSSRLFALTKQHPAIGSTQNYHDILGDSEMTVTAR